MITLSIEQKKLYAEKLIDFANYIAISLVISQFLTQNPNILVLLFGSVIFLSLYWVGYLLTKTRKRGAYESS